MTPFRHAVLVLRWFRQGTPLTALAHDAGISIAAGYRYLHEGIDVLAAQAPELADVLGDRLATDRTHVILDGTLIPTDRVRETTIGTKGTPVHLWYSGEHRRFGANVQFIATADGFPLWVSDLCGCRTIVGVGVAAGQHPRSDRGPRTRNHRSVVRHRGPGLLTLADQGYQGVGIGIHTPTKAPVDGNTLDADTACCNTLLTSLQCLGERAAALLTTRWKALGRITLCPNRIGSIVKAALVLTQSE